MQMPVADSRPGAGARLVLVLSSERSGSTLLRVMLGEHRKVVAPSEMFLLRYPDYDTWRAEKPVAMESLFEFFDLIGEPKDLGEIDSACRGHSTLEVYRWLLSFLPADAFLVDKTPAYANELETLARSHALRPLCLWILRHPMAVIDSHLRLKLREREQRHARLHPLRRAVLRSANRTVERLYRGMTPLARDRETKWVIQQMNIRSFLRHVPVERKSTIHYEDLVGAPAEVLSQLCRTMGIDVDRNMLQPETRDRVMNPHLGDPNFHTRNGVDPRLAYAWTERLPEARLRVETIQLMRQLRIPSPRRSRIAAMQPQLAPATR